MCLSLKNYFTKTNEVLSRKPVKHNFFKDASIANEINEKGYAIVNFLPAEEHRLLTDLYVKHYNEKHDGKGAFLDVMSKNINDTINTILTNAFDTWLINYKNAGSTFVVKTPGKAGTVPVHQDLATTDESLYSSLNVWIPMQDITDQNGALQVVPGSHRISNQYRCSTMEPFTKNIQQQIQPYFIPVYLKAGQALFFDSRMFHYSTANLSAQNRAVTICRILHKEASFVTYFKEEGAADNRIEMWRLGSEYLTANSYSHNLQTRPEGCEFLGYKYADTTPLTAAQFERISKKLGIVACKN